MDYFFRIELEFEQSSAVVLKYRIDECGCIRARE